MVLSVTSFADKNAILREAERLCGSHGETRKNRRSTRVFISTHEENNMFSDHHVFKKTVSYDIDGITSLCFLLSFYLSRPV